MNYYNFKNASAWGNYCNACNGLLDMMYKIADARYWHDNDMHSDIKSAISEYIEQSGSAANPSNVEQKLMRFIDREGIDYAFNLPEHPEKHNGYLYTENQEIEILCFFGFNFKLNFEGKVKRRGWLHNK